MPNYHGFDHITLWTSNALQAALYYTARHGFSHIAYRGLETGDRDLVSHVLRQGNVTFLIQSPLHANAAGGRVAEFVSTHGDAVKDVAFEVDDVRTIYERAVERGARSVREPWTETDEHGTVVMATVATYGDVEHTFVERKNYKGHFLPGFKRTETKDPIEAYLPPTNLDYIDHVVGNQADGMMVPACEFYEKCLDFHRFWSVDDSQIHTEYSSLRSIVMTSTSEKVKMPINEPAPGLRKSQIQEYVDYNSGAGVQHIALNTRDVIAAVKAMRARGAQFLTIPDSYYENLKLRLNAQDSIKVKEDLEVLRELKILVDFDERGYLLQIFTKPVQDRPTLFLEIIQRENHEGFGAGNFKSLFEAIEIEQEKRGNL